MQNCDQDYTWNPLGIFTTNGLKLKYAVIVLNRPIQTHFKSDIVLNVWENACVRITVDGGTDRWLAWLDANSFDKDTVTAPELLTGDMDSITMDALEYFRAKAETNIVTTEDQNKTDFTKSVLELQRYLNERQLEIDDLLVFTSSSGRFDQLLSNINTLYISREILPKVKMYIFASDSLTWLLPAGKHTLDIPLSLRQSDEWCGLLPIGSPCKVTTTGLKWNIVDGILQFGGMVSSSNTYNGDEVTIFANGPVVWSMGIVKLCDSFT